MESKVCVVTAIGVGLHMEWTTEDSVRGKEGASIEQVQNNEHDKRSCRPKAIACFVLLSL